MTFFASFSLGYELKIDIFHLHLRYSVAYAAHATLGTILDILKRLNMIKK